MSDHHLSTNDMPASISEALHGAAWFFGVGIALAAAYCFLFALITGRNAVELLPSIMAGYALLAGAMLSRGHDSEQRNEVREAANYYARALGYHLVATVAYLASMA